MSSGAKTSRRWRVVDVDEAHAPGYWIVSKLDFFARVSINVGAQSTRCLSLLDAALGAPLSSGSLAAGNASYDALGALVAGPSAGSVEGTSWRSQWHAAPEEAWIGIEFREPVRVRCLQLNQGGFDDDGSGANRSKRVMLQRQSDAQGGWENVWAWGGADADALPGGAPVTLPVGLSWQRSEQPASATATTTVAGAGSLASAAHSSAAPAGTSALGIIVGVLIGGLVISCCCACVAFVRWKVRRMVLKPGPERRAATDANHALPHDLDLPSLEPPTYRDMMMQVSPFEPDFRDKLPPVMTVPWDPPLAMPPGPRAAPQPKPRVDPWANLNMDAVFSLGDAPEEKPDAWSPPSPPKTCWGPPV